MMMVLMTTAMMVMMVIMVRGRGEVVKWEILCIHVFK